jgi:gliding motility-associated-like protein
MFSKKLYLFLMFLFFAQFAQGQLSNFTLNVTKTNETCTSNGTLSFAVSNTTVGATMLYSIYLLPNVTTPLSVQSATSISGLAAGNYRVIATQSIGNQSGSQQQDILISNSIAPLTYQLSSTNEVCGNDGTITVNITGGTPLNYEIFSGPMTRPLQASNVFTGLTAGIYQIRVFDVCNQGVVQTFTLFRSNTNLNVALTAPSLGSCTTVNIGFTFQSVLPAGVIRYPIQVTAVFLPPTGPSVTFNQTITSGNGFVQQVPYYPNQTCNYSFTITDGCNTVYHLNGSFQSFPPIGDASYTVAPQDCVLQLIGFSNVNALNLVSAPSGYTGAVPQSFTASIVNLAVTVRDLVPGTYVFNAVDACGNPHIFTIVVVPNENGGDPPYYSIANGTCIDATLFIYQIQDLVMVSGPSTYTAFPLPHDFTGIINSADYAAFVHLPIGTYIFNVIDQCNNPRPLTIIIAPTANPPVLLINEGCETGVGSFQITGDLQAISIISAPTSYTGPVPANLVGSIVANGTKLSMDGLLPGTYVFQSTNSCSNTFTTTVTIAGYHDNTTVALTPNCGSFNIAFNHTSNNNTSARYWLQKLNPVTGGWEHPLTSVVYTDGTFPTAVNSFELTNNVITYNLAFSGHFRILKVFRGFSNANPSSINCYKVIHEFDFSDAPRIIDVYSISCGSTFEVIVNAVGNSALTYRITTKNGQPFIIQNGNSSLFSGLAPALYNFQVEDACGNRVNSQFEILNPNPIVIAADLHCDGESASLTAPNFSFLTYQWWKDNNTATILSTTNSLSFPSFNSVLNSGTYHVRITYPNNQNSCLNQILNYIIPPNSAPHAGNDNSVSYCGRQGVMNLNALLIGNFDLLGSWSETTSSGMLINNLWDTSSVPFATYQFKYIVSGNCDLEDEAIINITIKEIPQIPVASVNPIMCETQNLNLFATTVPNGSYHWTGPNGFISALQNPTLTSASANENGTYTVNATQNGCQSGDSSVVVLVNPLPIFALSQDCVGKDVQVWFTRLNETSFDETSSTYSWTGPNNFVANQNPITITGGALGIYSLQITNQYGCETTNTIDVQRNICFIPNVITPNNDDYNESLNLTGFDVTKLEIFNRWGTKVYEKSNYLDEWHGQNMSGGQLPDSTYYYVIQMGVNETKTGWIYLGGG